ncbi:MAG: phenylalanine--tRNA ligase subunit alpha [Candidatus Kerfeldbacteria bacterium]|nr:phenylalanine--tRNA ligase subunit alpha [Candidatus Kerfeldbacteria bacterium]
MDLLNELKKIARETQNALRDVTNAEELEKLKTQVLGRNGVLSKAAKHIQKTTKEQRPVVGKLMNEVKQELETTFQEVVRGFQTNGTHTLDITQPGTQIQRGHEHPLSIIRNRIAHIVETLGFSVTDGDECSTDYFNFEVLNFQANHPARDSQDTFFVEGKQDGSPRLMRTQTSTMQVPWMQRHTPPTRAVVIGRVFRNEATDASHEHTFHQIEGFAVDRNISAANLKYTLRQLVSAVMEQDVRVRFRPSFFPFVEPGYEMDMSCTQCEGRGCRVCKHVGWVELVGCGMIHPNVLVASGYERGAYTGFAFGMGLERLAMMRYGIEDIRLFHSGDLGFLHQFSL